MFEDKIHDECGIFGIYKNDKHLSVKELTYFALYALQHRGQESCGMTINDDGVLNTYREIGLISDVFNKERLNEINDGNIAIGHVRYSKIEFSKKRNAQPIQINHNKGSLSIALNGSIVNIYSLKTKLENEGAIFHTATDTEVIAYLIARERLIHGSIEEAVEKAVEKLEGAFSFVITSPRKLVAVRDPKGIRPLCIGMIDNSYIVASESCAINSIGGIFMREIEAGEIVIIDENGLRSIKTYCNKEPGALCAFEYVYIARPDSEICGTSVHEARKRMGALLAQSNPTEADVVIGVPDSGIDAAIGYAEESGIPYGIGLIKNKYIGRTFIKNEQKDREKSVKIKLNTVASTLKGKRVIMVEDSIVRGTTCAHIVKLLKDAGAKEVHLRSASPPFLFPCYLGVDVESKDDLVAHLYTKEELCKMYNADSIEFLQLKDIYKIFSDPNQGICCACFNGEYPCDISEMANRAAKNKYETKIKNNGG